MSRDWLSEFYLTPASYSPPAYYWSFMFSFLFFFFITFTGCSPVYDVDKNVRGSLSRSLQRQDVL